MIDSRLVDIDRKQKVIILSNKGQKSILPYDILVLTIGIA